MFRAGFLQQFTLTSVLLFCTVPTFANPTKLAICPSVEQLQSFTLSAAFSIGFDAQTNKLHYLAMLESGTPEFNDYGLILSPIDVFPGESPKSNISQQLASLRSNSDTPISSNIFTSEENSEFAEVCTYSSDNNNIQAVLYFVGDDEYSSDARAANTINSSGFALGRLALQHP
jgi:hypothetical protein